MTKICLYFKAILHFVLLADNIDIAYMVILLLSKRPLLVWSFEHTAANLVHVLEDVLRLSFAFLDRWTPTGTLFLMLNGVDLTGFVSETVEVHV